MDKKNTPKIVAISGVKNSGKTTFLTRLIPILQGYGLKVGVIKHDGHQFEPDLPDTDSFKLRKAGAKNVIVYSKDRYMLVKEESDIELEGLIELVGPVDLVFLEGAKYSPYPKVEILRKAVSSVSVCDRKTLIAICTDVELDLEDVPILDLEAYEKMAQLIFDL